MKLKALAVALVLAAPLTARAEATWYDAVEQVTKTGDRARVEALIDGRVLSLVNFLACARLAGPREAVMWCGSQSTPSTKDWARLSSPGALRPAPPAA